jgi:crossover junction endodeoxyribonuclease RuvC
VAMCHYFQSSSTAGRSANGVKGWDEFIKKNPGRVK